MRAPGPCVVGFSIGLSLAACVKENEAFEDTGSDASTSQGTTGVCESDTLGTFGDPDSEADAIDLGNFDVSAAMVDGTQTGALSRQVGSWWARADIDAAIGCEFAANAVVEAEDNADTQVCAFARCVDDPDESIVLCNEEGSFTQSPAGRMGCCGTNVTVLSAICSFGEADVFFEVRRDSVDECSAFRLAYSFRENFCG